MAYRTPTPPPTKRVAWWRRALCRVGWHALITLDPMAPQYECRSCGSVECPEAGDAMYVTGWRVGVEMILTESGGPR